MSVSFFHFRKKKVAAAVALIAGSLLFSILLFASGPFKSLSLRVSDLAFRYLPLSPPHPDILIITIDQPDIDFFKDQGVFWPWPRQLYAKIIDFCRAGGARGILFDILFTEPSSYGPMDDENLADSAAQFGNVTFSFFLSREEKTTGKPDSLFLNKASLPADSAGTHLVPPYRSMVMPVAELTAAAAALGHVSGDPDADGIFRRIRPIIPFNNRPYPTLALAAFSKSQPNTFWGIHENALVRGTSRIPIDPQGSVILKFRGPARTHMRFSAANVIQSQMRLMHGVAPIHPLETVRGKWVLLGLTAPGLMDLRATPVGAVYPGVEIHATFLDNLLSGDFLKPVPTAVSWTLAGLTAAGVVASVFCVSGFFATLAVPLLFASGNIGIAIAAFSLNFSANPVFPLIVLIVAFFFSAAYSYATEGRQKKVIRNMFGHYLSDAVIGHLLADPQRLQLGGERRRVTLFFSDLAGFTSLSERLEPEAVVSLLNQYLSRMTEIILEESGAVDKFEGDAIMAFWGAPLDQPDQAALACRTALRQQGAMGDLNQRLSEQNLPPLRMRIGIHTGEAVVGNLGSENRFDFTVIGDTVNLASRLEGLNKFYGTEILVSEVTASECKDVVEFMEIDRVAVKGRASPITVFSPLSLHGALSEEQVNLRKAYLNALKHYRMGEFETAAGIFETIQRLYPQASAAKLFGKRCRSCMDNPVPEGWDAIFRPDQK